MSKETNIETSQLALMERRGRQRFRIELPCYVVGRESRAHKPVGRTSDISRSGVLIVWDKYDSLTEIPSLGAVLKLDLELPPNSFGRRYLHCRGRVVRVQAAQGQYPQIAVSINQIEFRGELRKPLAGLAPGRKEIEELLM